GDGVADGRDGGEALRQALDQRLFRALQFLVRDRLLTNNSLQLLHKLDQRSVSLGRKDRAARSKGARTFAVTEIRVDAVAVALLLANVCVEPRLKLTTENRVQHLQRKIVGRVARWTRQSNIKDSLCRARLIDEIDLRGLKLGQLRIIERRLVSAFGPGRERFLYCRFRFRRSRVADNCDDRAARLV